MQRSEGGRRQGKRVLERGEGGGEEMEKSSLCDEMGGRIGIYFLSDFRPRNTASLDKPSLSLCPCHFIFCPFQIGLVWSQDPYQTQVRPGAAIATATAAPATNASASQAIPPPAAAVAASSVPPAPLAVPAPAPATSAGSTTAGEPEAQRRTSLIAAAADTGAHTSADPLRLLTRVGDALALRL